MSREQWQRVNSLFSQYQQLLSEGSYSEAGTRLEELADVLGEVGPESGQLQGGNGASQGGADGGQGNS